MEKEAKEAGTLRDVYREYVVPAVGSIKKALSDNFGDNFDFKVTKRALFLEWLKENDKGNKADNAKFFKRCLRGVENTSHSMRRLESYTIIIRFPELTVTNSRGGKQRITDMYIKIRLSPLLNDIDSNIFFTGMRTSYSFAEFSSGYNFSHLSGMPSDFIWSHFCLGGTHFATLCHSLAVEFNGNFFELFCQQLGDYLSWESLEGGPYKRLENIHERGGSTLVHVTAGDLSRYYKSYLALEHTPNVELKSNDFYYGIDVVVDDDLRKVITSIVDKKEHLQYWDSERKVAADVTINNRVLAAERMVSQHGTRNLFMFKDVDVKFALTDIIRKEEKDSKTKVAHTTIMNHIVDALNASLVNNIKNEFIKKSRSYITG